jgi:hypothetical protein
LACTVLPSAVSQFKPRCAPEENPMKMIFVVFCFLLSLGSATAQAEKDAFQKVFDVIANPNIYVITEKELFRRLAPLCSQRKWFLEDEIKSGNVECDDFVRSVSFNVQLAEGNLINMLDASFRGVEKCAYMQKVLIKNFGKPWATKGRCQLHWWPPTARDKQQHYVTLEVDPSDGKVYFAIGQEQGIGEEDYEEAP